VILGGILLSFMAFYNNYPLLYSDTAAYIYSGFLDGIPNDRPKIYGLFLRHISLAEITWLVVLAQGTLVSLTIFYLVKYFLPKHTFIPLHFICIAFLVFFTGVSVLVSMLIPDIFTSIFLMSLALLLIAPIKNKRDLYLISILFWLGLIMHNSHIFIAFAIILFFSIVAIMKKRFAFQKQRLMRCTFIILLGMLTIPTTHYLTDREFIFSKGAHVFMMNHLIETGVIDQFLKENCPNESYTLCDFQGKIPTDFIWDTKKSPLHILWKQDDMWEKSKVEYNQIIKEIFTTPKYLLVIGYKSITYTLKQFFSYQSVIPSPHVKHSPGHGAISWLLQNELREQELALQQRRNQLLDISKINARQDFLFLLSLCFYVIAFCSPTLRSKLSFQNKQLLLFLMIGLLANAFVCSNLSTVVPRYQNRLIWLLPLVLLICSFDIISKSRNFLGVLLTSKNTI